MVQLFPFQTVQLFNLKMLQLLRFQVVQLFNLKMVQLFQFKNGATFQSQSDAIVLESHQPFRCRNCI